jgi:hypothetical protein
MKYINNNFHFSKLSSDITSNSNFIFWISMINESQKIINPKKRKNVLDINIEAATSRGLQ